MSFPAGLGRPLSFSPPIGAQRLEDPSAETPDALDEDGTGGPEDTSQAPTPGRPIRRGDQRDHRPDQRTTQLRQLLDAELQTEPPTGLPGIVDGRVDAGQLDSVPQAGRPVGGGGKGDLFTDGTRSFTQMVLDQVKPPAAEHPYTQHKAQIRGDLEQLGLMTPGTGRVHIDDGNVDHGGAVARAAVGPTSLAHGAEATLNANGVPEAFRADRRTEDQQARLGDLGDRRSQGSQGQLTSDQLVRLSADELEGALLDHGDAVAHVRSQLPADGRDTFMNMSWGQSAERMLGRSTAQMLMAPEGSPAFEEATEILGHPPTITQMGNGQTRLEKEEFQTIRAHLEPKLDAVLQSDEHQTRMGTARTALETELTAGRTEGLLVFAAAGNEYGGAAKHGRPDLAESTASGAKGLVLVGATDLGAPGTEDDVVADFSNQGSVTVSAAGVDIPVGGPPPAPNPFGGPGIGTILGGGVPVGPSEATNQEGTSFASPVALEAAYLADAVNPELSVDQIADLMTDPRAVHDIAGTTRDGAGQIDHFAVALLAANPNLSRAQIDAARTTLSDNPSDAQVAALRTRLGLD